tara:strand:- start:432 stop:587 length:156 start_codon:yes stop_codon:yes gene_type:complete
MDARHTSYHGTVLILRRDQDKDEVEDNKSDDRGNDKEQWSQTFQKGRDEDK